MKIKKFLVATTALSLGASIVPSLTACSKNDVVTSLTATYKDKNNLFYIGDMLITTSFAVIASYKSGAKKIIHFDSTGEKGYTIESNYDLGYKFEDKDLGKEVNVKFKFKDATFDLKLGVGYSEKVKFDVVGANVVSISKIETGKNIVVTYKPETDNYYTDIQETGIDINGQSYTVYDEMIEYKTNRVKLEYVNDSNGRTIKMTIDKSIVTSETMNIWIIGHNYANVGVVHFKPYSENICTLEGTTFETFKLNNTKWSWLTKPKVVPKTGYMFTKWIDKNRNEFTDDQTFSEDFEATAICEETSIDVDFNAEFGTVEPYTLKVPPNIKFSLVANQVTVKPSEGYKFDRWVDNNGNTIDPDYQITSHFLAKAICVPITYYEVTFEAGEHGSITGETSQIVEEGTKFSDITKPEPVAEEHYGFAKWVYKSTTTEVKPDDKITAHTAIVAQFAADTSHVFFSMVEENGTWAKDVFCNQRGEFKDLQWSEVVPGWEGGRSWALKPTFDPKENKLVLSFNRGHKNLDFRFITQMLKISIPTPAHTTRKVNINIKTKTDLFNTKEPTHENNVNTTLQVFLLYFRNDHPNYFANLKDEDDKRAVDPRTCFVKAAYHEHGVQWGHDQKCFEKDGIMELDCRNDTSEQHTYDSYIMVSFLIEGKARYEYSQHNASTEFFFSYKDLK